MSALVEVLYPLPDVRRTPLSTLRWWESRRPFYNLVVGGAGLFTMAVGLVIGPGPTPGPVQLATFAGVYALLANLCYSMGWGAEMAAKVLWGRQAPRLGPLLFRQGLIFSVGVTLLPVLVMTLARTAQLVVGLLGIVLP